MKIHYILFLFFVGILFSLFLNPAQSFADGGCFALNNGGVTTQQFCPTPTPTPQISSAPANNDQQQQDTNQPSVYPSSSTKSTPDTGTADWSLPLLMMLAGAGLLLRNKTKGLQKIN